MGKIVFAEICNIMLKMDEQYQENFNTIKTELEELRARDVEKESRLRDFEIKLSQLLVENKKQEDTIVKLSKIVDDSREENSKVGVTDGKDDDTTDTAVTAGAPISLALHTHLTCPTGLHEYWHSLHHCCIISRAHLFQEMAAH